jgi:hypothetical protein
MQKELLHHEVLFQPESLGRWCQWPLSLQFEGESLHAHGYAMCLAAITDGKFPKFIELVQHNLAREPLFSLRVEQVVLAPRHPLPQSLSSQDGDGLENKSEG